MKFTYAIVVSKMLSALIVPSAQNMIDLNAPYDVHASGYQLGTNDITGKNEIALPHVTLIQFHADEESFKISLDKTAQLLKSKRTIMPQELSTIGYNFVPVNPAALQRDEPNLPNRLFWCDVGVKPSDVAALHLALVDVIKQVNPDLTIYNAHGVNYRPHFTLARVSSPKYDSFLAAEFPVNKMAAKNFKLVAAESTPSGMLYESKIKYEFDFDKMQWVEYQIF
jgi:hypothetical protein